MVQQRQRNAKGYGFLGRDDGGSDVFVHYSGIIGKGYRTLNKGDRVESRNRRWDKGAASCECAEVRWGLEGPRIKEVLK